jgi:hypothetical protein
VHVLADGGKAFRELPTAAAVTSLACSPDGKTLVLGGAENLYGVDPATGKQRWRLSGHWNRHGCVAVSPDGRYLASGGGDYGNPNYTRLAVYEVLTGTAIYPFPGGPVVHSVAFSPDNARLVIGYEDATALIWDLKNLSGKPRRATLSAQELATRWQALAQPNAKDAYEARADLLHAPNSAVLFLAGRLRPEPAVDLKRVEQLIHDLGHNQFGRRDAARRELEKLGELVEDPLRKAQAGKLPLEVQRRIDGLVAKLEALPLRLQELRAIEILEGIGTPEAWQHLQRLADGNSAGPISRQARLALERHKKARGSGSGR